MTGMMEAVDQHAQYGLAQGAAGDARRAAARRIA